MTIRRDYDDSYCTTFDATLLQVTEHQGQPALLLDATYFYPTSGGQAHDLGTLAGRRVVDVVASDGQVLHVLAQGETPPDLGPVQGIIDWPRRFDHMQQHSGQHLLSQVFYRECGCETVSVHFGALESTLDLDAAELTPAQLAHAEAVANDLAARALPITATLVDERGLATIPLRRLPKVTGQIRIVEIQGYDYSACGGTHVRTTAEIGPLKLVRQERRRGQTRVTFLCGKRAIADYIHKHDLLVQAAAHYSTDVEQVPELMGRGLEQVKALQRRVDELTTQLVGYEVTEVLAQAQSLGDLRVVARRWDDRGVDALKTLANLLQTEPGVVALLASVQVDKTTLIFARSADVDRHMGNLLRDTLKAFGGAGGGRPEFAQGGGIPPAQADAALQHALAALGE